MYWKHAYYIDYFPDMYVKKVVAKALYMQIDDWLCKLMIDNSRNLILNAGTISF